MPDSVRHYLSWNNSATSGSVYIALELASDIRFLECDPISQEKGFPIAFDMNIKLSSMSNSNSNQSIEKSSLALLAWFQYLQKLPYRSLEEESPIFKKHEYKEEKHNLIASFFLQTFSLKNMSINDRNASLLTEFKGIIDVHLYEEDKAGLIKQIHSSLKDETSASLKIECIFKK